MDATATQRILIARLCIALEQKEPIEDYPMSRGEAGVLIRGMIEEVKAKRRLRKSAKGSK